MLVFYYFLKVLLAAQFNSMCPPEGEGHYQPIPPSMHKEARVMLRFSKWGQGLDGNIPDTGRRGMLGQGFMRVLNPSSGRNGNYFLSC